MTSSRTKVSNWVYRIALSLLVLGTLRHGQFMYDQFPSVAAETATPAVYWTALLAVMGSTFTFALACVAMVFRSGSVVWLLGLQFVLICFTAGPSFVLARSTEPMLIGIAIALVIFGIGAALFTYLIAKNEIRHP